MSYKKFKRSLICLLAASFLFCFFHLPPSIAADQIKPFASAGLTLKIGEDGKYYLYSYTNGTTDWDHLLQMWDPHDELFSQWLYDTNWQLLRIKYIYNNGRTLYTEPAGQEKEVMQHLGMAMKL